MIEVRKSEKCLYHWRADEATAPGYIHHALFVVYERTEGVCGKVIGNRFANEFVVSHSETGNYAHCGSNVHPILATRASAEWAAGIGS